MKKLLACIFTVTLLCVVNTTEEAAVLRDIEVKKDDNFSAERLQRYIIEKKLKHPHIVYAQALLETGWFTSTIYKENHNLFGMKYVHDFNYKYVRPTTAIGSRYKHAVYSHWKKSVDDYLLWQQMFKKTPTDKEEDYFKLLKLKYAEDKRYVAVLKGMIKTDTTQWQRY